MDLTAPLLPLGALGHAAALLAAVTLGAAFGFALERAGLGHARKLAAQFYLRDLTVFKVMFSAILTAMLGLFWLSRLGLVDLARIPPGPTYLVPQLAGGLLFGAGFVVGGYCPGTSCVAAASGRLDGLAVLGGMMLGIFLYGEAWPRIEGLANATALGRMTLPTLLGVRPGIVVGGLTVIALAAFWLAGRIERSQGNRLVEAE